MTNLSSYIERPTIYVSLAADADPQSYHWVEVGAEEEGVPCRLVAGPEGDAVGLAYGAAQGSRLGVGVGIAAGRAALHEARMPPGQPVFAFGLDSGMAPACRLMGSNAGRMVKHMPLRLSPEQPKNPDPADTRPAVPIVEAPISLDAKALAETIARVLRQRGVK